MSYRIDKFCRRERTVSEIRLFKTKMIHIRRTPASGKTTLLVLLHEHLYQKYPNIGVKYITWLELTRDNKSSQAISEIMDEPSRTGFVNTSNKCQVLDKADAS